MRGYAAGAWLIQHAFAVEISPPVKIARQRPGLLQCGQVFIERGQAVLSAMGQIDQVVIGRIIANQFAEASFPSANRARDRSEFAEPLLGDLGGGVEPGQRGSGFLEQIVHFNGSLGGDRPQIGEGRRIRPAGSQLDGLGADQTLGGNTGDGVGADQVPEPFVNPQDQLDRLARLAGRDDRSTTPASIP